MSDPNIRRAADALKALSEDPAAQELARQRELGQINLRIMRQFEYEAGETKGRVEGEAKGRVEGEAMGKAGALLAVLDARGLALTEEQRQRILSCTDLEQLNTWVRKAVTVAKVAELFA